MNDPEELESGGYHATCFECETEFSRALEMREVMMDLPSGGYDMVPVPMCSRCIGERFGWDCPQCGIHHDTKEDARYCCERAPGEAPDCPECGRRMERVSWGFTADGAPTCEVAECEECDVQWGKFTGWNGVNA